MGVAKECGDESATDRDSQRLFNYQHLSLLKEVAGATVSVPLSELKYPKLKAERRLGDIQSH